MVGVKEATGSALRASQIIARVGDRLAVLSGDDATAFPLYALGARGVISVVSNVAPALMSAMWDAAAAGDWEQARELHYRLLPLAEGLFVEANPIPVKAALAMMGRIADEIRPPLYPLAAQTATSSARSSHELGLRLAWRAPVRIAVLGADGRMGRALMRAVLAAGPRAELAAAVRARRARRARARTPAPLAGVADRRADRPASCRPRAAPTSGSTSPPPARPRRSRPPPPRRASALVDRHDRPRHARARGAGRRGAARSRSSSPPTTRSASTSC